jgi:hypothetical protein
MSEQRAVHGLGRGIQVRMSPRYLGNELRNQQQRLSVQPVQKWRHLHRWHQQIHLQLPGRVSLQNIIGVRRGVSKGVEDRRRPPNLRVGYL